MKWLKIIAVCLFGFMAPEAGGVLPAMAQSDQDEALKGRKKGDIIPYGQIAKQAARQFGGRVVGQNLRQNGGRWVYVLRILRDNGQVIEAVYDAKTGRLLRTSGR